MDDYQILAPYFQSSQNYMKPNSSKYGGLGVDDNYSCMEIDQGFPCVDFSDGKGLERVLGVLNVLDKRLVDYGLKY